MVMKEWKEGSIIPLYDLKDQAVYSGYHICGVCESIILTIGGYSDEFIETHINEKLDDLKEELIQKLINAIRSLWYNYIDTKEHTKLLMVWKGRY